MDPKGIHTENAAKVEKVQRRAGKRNRQPGLINWMRSRYLLSCFVQLEKALGSPRIPRAFLYDIITLVY